ncbi:MAG: chorismate mutase [Spirochaetaceae bacterium]|jgi:chorismate mutase|nr:chorismate mutase [Spirochaetaceae bacterium]
MMNKRLYGIRGAVSASNTEKDITEAVDELFSRLFGLNNVDPGEVVSVQFTVTGDLTACNPAGALRKSSLGRPAAGWALFCSQEPDIQGAPPGIIRVLVTAYLPGGTAVRHVYVRGAEKLRPDLAESR